MDRRRENERSSSLQQAFAAQAEDLGLPAESVCDPDTRAIGIAFAMFKKSVEVNVATPTAVAPGGAYAGQDSSSDAAITSVLQGYESLSPQTFGAEWRNYATDPHMGVGTSWVGTVDDDAVAHWLKSDALAKAIAAFPPYSPRRVTLQNVQIVYIGFARAAATYRVEEQHANGQTSAGNAAAVLLNVAGAGWRIAVVTKGGRGEV